VLKIVFNDEEISKNPQKKISKRKIRRGVIENEKLIQPKNPLLLKWIFLVPVAA